MLGGAAAFAVFFVIHVISPRGMGFGDVRLSFVLGCALGWLSWGHVYLGCSSASCSVRWSGSLLIALRLRTRKDHVPFGPFLAAGAMTAIFVGTQLLDLFSRSLHPARRRRIARSEQLGSVPTLASLRSASRRDGSSTRAIDVIARPMPRRISRRSLGSLMPATLNSTWLHVDDCSA